jgi:translation initiation factor 2 beta subunit (eIF-2beta)/eIF-5
MKVICKVNEKVTFELEGSGQKDIFEQLSSVQEVFGEGACGKCNSENIRFQVREVDGNKFYELKCNACGSTLAFGAHKKGDTLFPKRKDGDGKWLDNKGWTKWVPPAK